MHNCLFCYLPLHILEKKSNKCLLLPTLNSDFSSSQVTPNHPVCTLLPASERTGFPSPRGAGWDPNYKACSSATQGSPGAISVPHFCISRTGSNHIKQWLSQTKMKKLSLYFPRYCTHVSFTVVSFLYSFSKQTVTHPHVPLRFSSSS